MKAIVYREYGSPDVLKLEEVAKPAPAANEVLVRVHAASVNSWDWELLTGTFANRMLGAPLKPKHNILGADVAGRVEAVGSNVKQFQPGDEVFGDLCSSGWGAFAEYVCAHEDALVHKPTGLTFEQAAAAPQAAVMAMQGICDYRQMQPGESVLINGAGGGVGSFAIQLAKSLGAEVTGVDKPVKMEMMRSIGADHVIDYTRENFTRNGQQYDLILDNAAYHSVFDYRRALSPDGAYVVVGGSTPRLLQIATVGSVLSRFGDQTMRILMHQPNKNLERIGELLVGGTLVSVIDRTYTLNEVAEALRYFGSGGVKGKLVITVKHQ